ncbi:MAG TPA: hypothetical protein VGS80_17750, partial [Ktedonobacterales bacterium]|nr:hypothetical protein [Ktedonobacterales bacterium]
IVAAEALPHFADGVFFVSLAPLRDASLVARAIAQAVGLLDQGAQPPAEVLVASLRDKQVLLLLDNFEHLTAAAPLVADLLAACPGLTVLATSRAALHVRGEHEVPVPPLACPDPADLPLVEALAEVPAVALFVARAQAVDPHFTLNEGNAASVAAICRRLDGLPLALELAAARIRPLSPGALLDGLKHPLPLLTSGPSDLPEHQRTLRDTLAWSYALLTPTEQALFRRLAVCADGCSLQAAEAISSAASPLNCSVLDGISTLLDQHLLLREPDLGGEPRIGMLETLREYARERLEATGEDAVVECAHAAYYLALAERAYPKLKGDEQAVWLARLERDHANLRVALAWAVARAEAEVALRLVVALWWFWHIHGHLSEGRLWIERVLAVAQTVEHSAGAGAGAGAGASAAESTDLATLRGEALHGAATLAQNQGDLAAARLLEQTRSACAAALGDTAFAAAWAEATAMTQERAIAQAASSPTEGAEEKATLLAFATRAAQAR